MNALSAIYGGVARLRRSWYERDPARQRRLARPVISVGNLVVGGAGKTPVVAAFARLLLEAGHRPAILSRGYARRRQQEGVVVVSDGERVVAPAEDSGDEPQMLARSLPGVPVLVSRDRYLAGRLAESRFAASVHILDDGFQHVRLARTVDLLVVSEQDLDAKVLPSGPLREPLAAARSADAVLVYGTQEEAARLAERLEVPAAFSVQRHYGELRAMEAGLTPRRYDEATEPRRGDSGTMEAGPKPRRYDSGTEAGLKSRRDEATEPRRDDGGMVPSDGPVVAVAGIARPSRFFDALRAQGLVIARELPFRDHHWYTARDLERIAAVARECGASTVVTTEKDAVRFDGLPRDGSLVWAVLPMDVSIEPAASFRQWLGQRI